VYVSAGQAAVPWRRTQYVSAANPTSVAGAQTLLAASHPASLGALAGAQRRALCVHGAGPTSAVGCGVHVPGLATEGPSVTDVTPLPPPGPCPPALHEGGSSDVHDGPSVTVPHGFEQLPSANTFASGAEHVLDGRLHVHAHVEPASPGDAKPVNAGVGRKAAPQLGGSGAGAPLPSKSSNGPSHPSGAAATQTQAPDAAPPSLSRIGTASSNPQIVEHPTAAAQSTLPRAVRVKRRTGSRIESGILPCAA
jgi:hypothetical protein